MGTRECCNVCGEFFIIGQENEECPHGQIEDEENEKNYDALFTKIKKKSWTTTKDNQTHLVVDLEDIDEILQEELGGTF